MERMIYLLVEKEKCSIDIKVSKSKSETTKSIKLSEPDQVQFENFGERFGVILRLNVHIPQTTRSIVEIQKILRSVFLLVLYKLLFFPDKL